MPKTDSRVDAYIARAADFAKPMLISLRAEVHATCPEVEETIKWGMPHFLHHGILCGMAGFKAHCAFWFWKGELILPAKPGTETDAMGQFGHLTARSDLPKPKVLAGYIRQAMHLNESGVKKPSRPKSPAKKNLIIPADLTAALKKNKQARAAFDVFSYSHKKEYVEWIAEAKWEETRQKRLATTIQWLTEGKSRNWKYENC